MLGFVACKEEQKVEEVEPELALEKEIEKYEFGFKLNDYVVVRDTVRILAWNTVVQSFRC